MTPHCANSNSVEILFCDHPYRDHPYRDQPYRIERYSVMQKHLFLLSLAGLICLTIGLFSVAPELNQKRIYISWHGDTTEGPREGRHFFNESRYRQPGLLQHIHTLTGYLPHWNFVRFSFSISGHWQSPWKAVRERLHGCWDISSQQRDHLLYMQSLKNDTLLHQVSAHVGTPTTRVGSSPKKRLSRKKRRILERDQAKATEFFNKILNGAMVCINIICKAIYLSIVIIMSGCFIYWTWIHRQRIYDLIGCGSLWVTKILGICGSILLLFLYQAASITGERASNYCVHENPVVVTSFMSAWHECSPKLLHYSIPSTCSILAWMWIVAANLRTLPVSG